MTPEMEKRLEEIRVWVERTGHQTDAERDLLAMVDSLREELAETDAVLAAALNLSCKLKQALEALVNSIHQNKSLNDAFVCNDEEALDNARAALAPSKTEET